MSKVGSRSAYARGTRLGCLYPYRLTHSIKKLLCVHGYHLFSTLCILWIHPASLPVRNGRKNLFSQLLVCLGWIGARPNQVTEKNLDGDDQRLLLSRDRIEVEFELTLKLLSGLLGHVNGPFRSHFAAVRVARVRVSTNETGFSLAA
jgi:hypothetical protein